MKASKSLIVLILLSVSANAAATELTFNEGKRIFEADVWNEVHTTKYPLRLTKDAFVTGTEIKDNAMIHRITFYETKKSFKMKDWQEGAAGMIEDNFCKKPYVKSFPIILRFDVTVKKDKFDKDDRKEIVVANSKDVCK